MKHILRGQVYLAILTGTGCEQRGKRPVLIIQNNIGNHFSPTTLVAPITSSKKKRNLPVHVPVESNRHYKDSVILCEQIQVMDKSRLRKKLCTLGDDVMEQVDRAVEVSFDLNGGNTNE
ncbi:MAG: type II toxin-antitoxin system PemK/MazF family toxin [Oscillospiraceae bacterium]|nr:type II toxin-antitoxin system PemK/MazF family toxin [Oscillospiraceae bacterium]